MHGITYSGNHSFESFEMLAPPASEGRAHGGMCASERGKRAHQLSSSCTSLEPYYGAGWESLERWAGVLMCGLRPQPTVKSHLCQGGPGVMWRLGSAMALYLESPPLLSTTDVGLLSHPQQHTVFDRVTGAYLNQVDMGDASSFHSK